MFCRPGRIGKRDTFKPHGAQVFAALANGLHMACYALQRLFAGIRAAQQAVANSFKMFPHDVQAAVGQQDMDVCHPASG